MNTVFIEGGNTQLNIIVHRGTMQIGGSLIELATKSTRIILDIGKELPKLNGENEQFIPNMPTVEGLFGDGDTEADAIFISHSHGDHIGLFPYVNKKVPIFIGEKSCEIYNMTGRFTGSNSRIEAHSYLQHEKPIMIGDFKVIPYLVDHSAFDAYGFVIFAEGKSVVYTGDIREHGIKGKLTEYFLKSIPKEPDVLLMEGTILGRIEERIQTEEEIKEEASRLMSVSSKPVLVLQSSTNIDRLVGMYNATKNSNRMFVIDVFTAAILNVLGGSVGSILKTARVIYPYNLTNKMFENGEDQLMYRFVDKKIKIEELNKNPDYCMVIRSSMLGIIQHLQQLQGGLFIYSMWQGYREYPNVKKMLELIESKQMERVYLHTSGHAGIETLKKIANLSKPKQIIPIHTEHPNGFLSIFENVNLLKDKEILIV